MAVIPDFAANTINNFLTKNALAGATLDNQILGQCSWSARFLQFLKLVV
jgi:hypothetical protein